MKRMIRWGLVILVLAVAGASGWLALQSPAKEAAPRTVPVTRGNVEETVLASGVIEASSLVSVGAEVSGSIKTVNVALGDSVKTGDVIAEIDSLNQENAVKAAEASLANIQAQRKIQAATLAQAQVALTRADKLNPQQLISDADYQSAQLAVTTAEAQVEAIDAQIQQSELSVESAKLNLSRTKIVAPMDGTVVSLEVEVGQTVNASSSSPTIVKLANLDNMVVKAEISEADVPRVVPGQKVYFTILGDPNTRIDATLRAVEPAPDSISSDTTTSSSSSSAIYYNGLFDVANPDHKLRISMTAQVTIVLDQAENVLTVPSSVLTKMGKQGYSVLVWDQNAKKAEPKKVEVGLNNNVSAEVKSGLAEGDQVVTTSTSTASETASGARSGSTNANRSLLGGGGPPPF